MSYNEVNSVKFETKEQGQWPLSLQQFVERSFRKSQGLSEDKLVIFQQQLQDIISQAIQENTLWTRQWLQEELPIFKDPIEGSNVRKADFSSEFDSKQRKKQRMARFGNPTTTVSSNSSAVRNSSSGSVIGTSQDLEKHYLRLTSEPDPSKVRPLEVLEKSLEHILNRYHKDKTCTYSSYLNNQFKSIRQDLTVQHIKNDFTIKIYETHARIAIDNNDLGEFNQCQTQLKALYQRKRKEIMRDSSTREMKEQFWNNEFEFVCYRILYMLMTENHSEIYKLKLALTKEQNNGVQFQNVRNYKCVIALFDLQSYMIEGNYYQYFRIYRFFKSKAYMRRSAHLMTHFLIDKQRVRSLEAMSRAYRRIPVSYVMDVLDFGRNEIQDEDNERQMDNFAMFVKKYNLQDSIENNEIDCVKARGILAEVVIKQRKVDIKGQI